MIDRALDSVPPATAAGSETGYAAYGLVFRSDLPLGGFAAAAAAEPDVEVLFGAVPAELPAAEDTGLRYQAAGGRLLLTVDGVARFLVEEGRRIIIDACAGADPASLALFLQDAAIGALFHQREELVLRGSAVADEKGAWPSSAHRAPASRPWPSPSTKGDTDG